MIDENKNELLKQKVTEQAGDEGFVHHQWFVQYHLSVVEQIAHELCGRYPAADRLFVDALVWLHDYEKIIDFDNQYNTGLAATKELLQEIGYSDESIEKLCEAINRYNAKTELAAAPIEIQIVSSSDGASHFVGPFIAFYWYENPAKTIVELQADNTKKIATDWETKITLPEVKAAFTQRYRCALEVAGVLPATFLN